MNATSSDPKIAYQQIVDFEREIDTALKSTEERAMRAARGGLRSAPSDIDAMWEQDTTTFKLLERVPPTLKVMRQDRRYLEEVQAMLRTMIFVAESQAELSKHDKVMIQQAHALLARTP